MGGFLDAAFIPAVILANYIAGRRGWPLGGRPIITCICRPVHHTNEKSLISYRPRPVDDTNGSNSVFILKVIGGFQ